LKPTRGDLQYIFAGLEQRESELAIFVCRGRPFRSGSGIRGNDIGAGNDRSRLICDCADKVTRDDLPYGRFQQNQTRCD
jgi:hypothetical protein